MQRSFKTFSSFTVENHSGTQNVHNGDSIYHYTAGDELWSKIRSWIFMPNVVVDQTGLYNRTQRERKDKTTGMWLLESHELAQWKQRPNSLLWLRGKIGCGKTMLCSSIAQQLIHERCGQADIAVAHYYITVTEPHTRLFDTLLRSLVHQIGSSTDIARGRVERSYNNANQGNREPYFDELYSLLRDLLELYHSVFIIIDALDESKELEDTLEFIETLTGWNLPGVHLLMSSRELPSVQPALLALKAAADVTFMDVRTAEVNLDIEHHLRLKLKKGKKKWAEKDQQRIVNDLVRGAEGIFRYISVPLSKIEACRNQKDLNQILDHLPKTLDETYELFLNSVESEEKWIVRRILQWVTLSKRPLTLSELAHTIPVNSHTKPYFDEKIELFSSQDIVDICSPLVVFEDLSHFDDPQDDMALDTDQVARDSTGNALPSGSSRIHLAHSSVREYLLGGNIQNSSAKLFSISDNDAALTMAEDLLAYGVHVGAHTSSVKTESDVHAEWPLFQYAIDQWYYHAEDARDIHKSKIESLLLEGRNSAAHVYRSMTYPQPPMPFNPLSPPKLLGEQAGIPSEHHRKAGPCSSCEELKLGNLKNPQRHRWAIQQLRVSADSGCPMCTLMLNSLVYQWISRRSNQWPILMDSDTTKAEVAARETILSKAEVSNILLYEDPTGDPFLVVQCLHLIGRLSFEISASTSTSKGLTSPPKYLAMTDALIPKISRWLRTCESKHTSCTRTPGIQVPFRLVDVGDDSRDPSLITIDRPLDQSWRYTTLSYIWGAGPQRRGFTWSDNIAQYCFRIPLEHIPPVIMDAITLTRSLGIRFLWVDRLCIVQDDQEDTAMMLNEMPSIYTNSYLNIVAGVPNASVSLQATQTNACRFPDYHSKDGFTDFTVKWPASEAFYNMCGLNPEHYPSSWHFNSPVHRRGWILQEIRSAPRNLVFQAREDSLRTEQVYMQCKERIVWQSGLERCGTLVNQTDEHLDWNRTVELFSGLGLTKSGQRIPALSAVAQNSAEAFGREYAAGSCITDLIRALLWYRPQPGRISQDDAGLTPRPWSWAVWEGRCAHYWPHDVISVVKTVGIRERPNGPDPNDLEESYEYITRRFSLIIEAPIIQIDWSLCTKTTLEHTYNIGCDQAQSLSPSLRASCWFDTKDGTPNTPEHCVTPIFMLRLTRRAGLLLRKDEMNLEADKERFVRVGLFVVAKSARHPFECAETRQIVIA